jgi:hypothetical protein
MNYKLWISIGWIILCVIIYFGGLFYIPKLAEKKHFFLSPKLGRIMARKRGGKIIGFLDNLVGSGKHVNKETGVIENGEVKPCGLFWELFGAHFIVFDSAYKYMLATEAEEKKDGSLTYKETEVESIFLNGRYSITTLPVTSDGVRLKVKLQINTETLDAAVALSLPISWTIEIFTSTLGEVRLWFGQRKVEKLITGKKFSTANLDEFEKQVISRNDRLVGCGQKITKLTIIDIDFADEETKKAYSAPFVASREAQQKLTDAKAFADAATNNAKGIKEQEGARAETYKSKVESFGGNAIAAAVAIAAENGQGLRVLAISNGKQNFTVPLNDD